MGWVQTAAVMPRPRRGASHVSRGRACAAVGVGSDKPTGLGPLQRNATRYVRHRDMRRKTASESFRARSITAAENALEQGAHAEHVGVTVPLTHHLNTDRQPV